MIKIIILTILVVAKATVSLASNDSIIQTAVDPCVCSAKHHLLLVNPLQNLGEKDTNGWSAAIQFFNYDKHSPENVLQCSVFITNISTNIIYFWNGAYSETYTKIELLDSKGERVNKTVAGNRIGSQSKNEQIKNMVKNRFQNWVSGKSRTTGFVPVKPNQACHADFSISKLFDVKESGEYTLSVEPCLIERFAGEEYDPVLKIRRLPIVTTKIQIRILDDYQEKNK